jgi:hypothetical protein
VTATEGATTHISPAMAAAVGRQLSRQVSFPVAASDIRRWALAVAYPDPPPPLFWDEAYAATTVHGGIVAPEEFNPFAWMVAEPAGPARAPQADPGLTERSLGLEPPAVTFQLNGGLEVDYGVRIRPGDVITSVSTLGGYRERPGRLGLMLFTDLVTTWTNQHDQLVRRSRATVIRY